MNGNRNENTTAEKKTAADIQIEDCVVSKKASNNTEPDYVDCGQANISRFFDFSNVDCSMFKLRGGCDISG
mgnify:CR=1 FL=1